MSKSITTETWRKFLHTVWTTMAASEAMAPESHRTGGGDPAKPRFGVIEGGRRHDHLGAGDRASPLFANVGFEFEVLAAASREDVALPSQPISDRNRQLEITMSEAEGTIIVTIQAQGFASLQQVIGKRAVLRAGAIEKTFAFNRDGMGQVTFEDTPDVRRSLQKFNVELP